MRKYYRRVLTAWSTIYKLSKERYILNERHLTTRRTTFPIHRLLLRSVQRWAGKIKAELAEASISLSKLIKIAGWLKHLLQNIQPQDLSRKIVRVFTPEECEKINAEARGCILFLEQTGTLDPATREWLIDQAMDLDVTEIGKTELQYLLALVLFQQSGQRNLLNPDKSLSITNPQTAH